MAKILCKMCGGTIEVAREQKSCECPYCGSLVTMPRLDSDVKERLYARAEHFRQTQNFEKALATYEEIAKQDASDPEIFWGIVLSRFGIEYVEDPRSQERIPTCHRVQFDSILQDADYLEALELAAGTPEREIYEREAKRIAEIQREILKISAQEKPYDVFISFKEKTDAGTRTRDAVDAQEIYGRLTRAGLRVFFAPISLERKIGQHYEPFIFAALNSARVMVVIGSKVEYFNAPWVRNEWGRFLALLKKDRSRLLIPCFKDITAYDLPEELSMFQALDMAKLGFVQDLQHVIEKTVARSREREVGGNENLGGNAKKTSPKSGGKDGKIRRIYIFLADKNWERADEYCEKLLDENPENAEVYLLKTLAEFRCENLEKLFGCSIQNSQNFAKAKSFAQGDLREHLLKIDEKSLRMRDLRQFMNNGFYNKKTVPVSEKDCAAMLEKIEKFSKEDCAFWPEIAKAKREISARISADNLTAKQIENCLQEQKFWRALELAGEVKLAEISEAARERALDGAYSQATDLANCGRKAEALEQFLKLPRDFRETQLRILECALAIGDWKKVEAYFKLPGSRKEKWRIMLPALREFEKKRDNNAYHFYKLLADSGCAEARAWLEKDKVRDERMKFLRGLWVILLFIVAIIFWVATYQQSGELIKHGRLLSFWLFSAIALGIVSFLFPIYGVILWSRGKIGRFECNSYTMGVLFFDIAFIFIAFLVFLAGLPDV